MLRIHAVSSSNKWNETNDFQKIEIFTLLCIKLFLSTPIPKINLYFWKVLYFSYDFEHRFSGTTAKSVKGSSGGSANSQSVRHFISLEPGPSTAERLHSGYMVGPGYEISISNDNWATHCHVRCPAPEDGWCWKKNLHGFPVLYTVLELLSLLYLLVRS